MIAIRNRLSSNYNNTKLPFRWTIEECSNWLISIGLPQYRELFSKKEINGEKLLSFDKQQLNKLGIKKIKDQELLTENLQKLWEMMKERKNQRTKSEVEYSSESMRDVIASLSDLSKNYQSRIMELSFDKVYIKVCFCFERKFNKLHFKRRNKFAKVLETAKKTYGSQISLEHEGKIIETEKQWDKLIKDKSKITIQVFKNQESNTESSDVVPELRKEFQVIDCIFSSVVVLDAEKKIIFANNHCVENFGYSKEELVGQAMNTLLYDLNTKVIDNGITSFINGTNNEFKNVTGRTKSGELIPILFELSELYMDSKRYFVVTLNKYEMKEEKKSLMEQSRDLINDFVFPTVLLDGEGKVQGINSNFTELLGFQINDLLEEDLGVFIIDKNVNNKNNYLSNFQQLEQSISIKKRKVLVKTNEGKLKSVELSISERKENEEKIFMAFFI